MPLGIAYNEDTRMNQGMLEAFAIRWSIDDIIRSFQFSDIMPPNVTREDLYNFTCCNSTTPDLDDFVTLLNYGASFLNNSEQLHNQTNFMNPLSENLNFTNNNFEGFVRLIPSMIDRYYYNIYNETWWSTAKEMTRFYDNDHDKDDEKNEWDEWNLDSKD